MAWCLLSWCFMIWCLLLLPWASFCPAPMLIQSSSWWTSSSSSSQSVCVLHLSLLRLVCTLFFHLLSSFQTWSPYIFLHWSCYPLSLHYRLFQLLLRLKRKVWLIYISLIKKSNKTCSNSRKYWRDVSNCALRGPKTQWSSQGYVYGGRHNIYI